MMLYKGCLMVGLMMVSATAFGQKTVRDYLRSGNKLYKDSTFVKAEVDYRKALEVRVSEVCSEFKMFRGIFTGNPFCKN